MRAGINRGEGTQSTTIGANDLILVQHIVNGQPVPRLVKYSNFITGGGTGLTPNSVPFINGSGDFAEDNNNFNYVSGSALLTAKNISIGANGLVGSLSLFSGTAAKGKWLFTPVDNTGNTTMTITNAAQGGAYTYTIPDAGASASFVMTAGAQTVAGAKTFTSDIGATTANVLINTAGKGIQIKEGSNARMGTATLSSGTITISNTSVTANTRIFVSRYSPSTSTAIGILSVGTVTASTSFIINALKEADATVQTNDVSVVHWMLVEPL